MVLIGNSIRDLFNAILTSLSSFLKQIIMHYYKCKINFFIVK